MITMKILLVSLESIDNIGEELLRKTTEYLVRQSCMDVNICIAQFKPSRRLIPFIYSVDYCIGAILWKFFSIFRGNISYKFKNVTYLIKYSRYFSSKIRQSDKIILSIGMIKYGTQDFSYVFHLINKLATKYGKPVMMSAMSPQSADKSDWRYHHLVEAVNMPAVKMLTTRDGEDGLEILKSDYLLRAICCDYVGDPALWIPEVYGEIKKNTCNPIPYVGINIIRRGIFDDYNKAMSDDELINTYGQLICLLKAKGWKWSVFTNGMKRDVEVLRELQSQIDIPESNVSPVCEDGLNYSKMISSFDVVFGARLHACITSVAVGTPVVGFIWENKLKYFSKTMGISDFFFQPSEMTAEKILNKMEEALVFNFDFVNRDSFKMKTKESIGKFIQSK